MIGVSRWWVLTNPFEKYWSNWIIFPGRSEKKQKYLKPPPSVYFCYVHVFFHIYIHIYKYTVLIVDGTNQPPVSRGVAICRGGGA